MPVYHNENKAGRVLLGNREISKIFQGEQLVFQKKPPVVTEPGLVFYVPFADGSAKDVISGVEPTGGNISKLDEGYCFSGAQNVYSNVSPIDLTGNKYTFSAMYKRTGGTGRESIFGYSGSVTDAISNTSNNRGIQLYSHHANRGYLAGGALMWNGAVNTTGSPRGQDTSACHVLTYVVDKDKATALTTNGFKDGYKLYFDGVEVEVGLGREIYDVRYLLTSVNIGESASNRFVGYIKDLRIYNRALSQEEVVHVFNECMLKV